MKTQFNIKTLIIGMIIMLFANSVFAQEKHEIKVDFKNVPNIKDLFKKDSDCTYCLEPYHFQKSVKKILALDEKLTRTGKSKLKVKLSQKIVAFSSNASLEIKGLSNQISQGIKRSDAQERLLKLQHYVENILLVIDPPDKFMGDVEIDKARSTLLQLRLDMDASFNSQN